MQEEIPVTALVELNVLLNVCGAVKVLGLDTETQLIPAAHGSVTVSNDPVTPAAVMLTLYVPGSAQKLKLPLASAVNGFGAAVEHVESVQSVTGPVGTNGEHGVPVAAEVHTVIVAPAIGARNP
jgi:hypothetical protein